MKYLKRLARFVYTKISYLTRPTTAGPTLKPTVIISDEGFKKLESLVERTGGVIELKCENGEINIKPIQP